MYFNESKTEWKFAILAVIGFMFLKVLHVDISWVQLYVFIVLIDEMFYTNGNLYNYADDKTICSYGGDVSDDKSTL